MSLDPASLRPWATSPAVSRELRALLAADARPTVGLVLLVLLPGAFAPEMIPAASWRSVEGHRVAVVALELARDLATGRSFTATSTLAGPPPPRGVWCLALSRDGSALTWSTPVAFSSAPSSTPAPDAPADPTVAYLAARRRFPGGDA